MILNKAACCILICWFHCSYSVAQSVELLTPITSEINETSGLLFLNQKIITHNDSGGEAALYELDSVSGNILRKVIIENASNVDWEDVTSDVSYIYIGDFGNNSGSRTDLKVYRLSQSDFFNSPNDTVSADTITFNYSNQIDFTSTSFSTNFDAEAFVAYNDSLYIFTKNWGDNKTNIYALPKTPGDYQINKLDSINTLGLVTGATVSTDENSIVLCGYSGATPFIVELNQLVQNNFSGSLVERYDILPPAGYSVQIEGIVAMNSSQYYLTSELFFNGAPSGLYKLTKNEILAVINDEFYEVNVFPNPVVNQLTIESSINESLQIVNDLGQVVQTVQLTIGVNSIDVASLIKGVYTLRFSESKVMKKITVF